MSDDTQRLLGEANGKLDTLLELVRDHIRQDDERFKDVGDKLAAHAADINQAKGAKAATFALAAAVSGFVGVAVAAAKEFLK